MTHRRGFTLVEIMIVIVIGGLLVLLGFPRLRGAMESTNLNSARGAVASLHARARAVAAEQTRTTSLMFDGNRAGVVAFPRRLPGAGQFDTIGAVIDLNQLYGVTVTTAGDAIGFDPRGFGTNSAQATVQVSRSGHSKMLTISPFGRLQP